MGRGKGVGKTKGFTQNGRRLKEPKYNSHGHAIPCTQFSQSNTSARTKRFLNRAPQQNYFLSLTTDQQQKYIDNKGEIGN